MSKRTKFSKEVRERAVWMLVEHEREYGSGIVSQESLVVLERARRDNTFDRIEPAIEVLAQRERGGFNPTVPGLKSLAQVPLSIALRPLNGLA